MASTKSITPTFALKVLAPSLVAVGSIALLLLYIVNGIFEVTNRLDTDYSERLANSAVIGLRDNLESIIFDNAVWDDAAENAGSHDINESWADETWGFATALGVYDAVFIVNPDGRTLYAAIAGKRSEQDVEKYFGGDIGVLLDKVASFTGTRRLASGVLRTDSDLSTVAVARIKWSSTDVGRNDVTPNTLVFGRRIDRKVLSTLARRYAMEELRFVDSGEVPEGGVTNILSPTQQKIGVLTWKSRSPGNVVRDKFSYVVSMLVVMFVFMIAVLLYMSWKGFKEAHESQAEAVAASLRDDLTGLANRREMIAALTNHLNAARAHGTPLSVIYADLDGFKEVNDSYGHEVGDKLLKAAAAGFQFLAQKSDVVARLGGDEFAIILTGTGSSLRARAIAESMITFLEEPMIFDGRIASVSVSVGIVDLESDDATVEEIIRRADVAMYAAKSDGRNRTHVYQKSLDFKRDENRKIALELRQHIEKGNLTVVYQPIVDARTRRTKGVEALVRWPTNASKRYSPDVFIPVAEEFGLIEDLGRFVMKEACRQSAMWSDIFVSVNVSPIQFMNPNFAELVAAILAETGLDAKRLELEVTEGFIIDNASRADTIINRLHDMNVRVALDDFGTGFSSIGHLRRFKFDKLKLDRSMVTDILHQPSALRLVQGTIAMADALGLTVVAEGIEHENQVSVLRLAGCNQFQGYLFSKPVEAGEITAFLQDGSIALAG
jgi:diguanylate cyclase (GGDEF)-like protein